MHGRCHGGHCHQRGPAQLLDISQQLQPQPEPGCGPHCGRPTQAHWLAHTTAPCTPRDAPPAQRRELGPATTQGSTSATTTTPSASSTTSKNTTSTSTAAAAVTAAAAPPPREQKQQQPPPAPSPFAPCICPPPAAAAVAAAVAKIAPPRLDADSVPLPKRFTLTWQRGGVGQTTGDQTAFVFFHQRKCGGTSWRQLIDEASDRLVTIGALRNKRRDVYISGFNDVRRDAYTLDKLQVQDRGFIAIAAGHLVCFIVVHHVQCVLGSGRPSSITAPPCLCCCCFR